MKKKLTVIGLLASFFLFACGQENENSISDPTTNLENTNQSELFYENQKFLMTDSIPNAVNEKALEIAGKNLYSNIKIVKVETKGNPTYNILYFNNNGFADQSFNVVLSKENRIKSVNQLQFQSRRLHKTAVTLCWHLAKIYKGAGYTGDSFTFSQAAIDYGWFHKVIWNCANSQSCCGFDYLGNFNDQTSSFGWTDDRSHYSGYGYIARPVNFKIWEDANRGGEDNDWEAGKPTSYSPRHTLDCSNLGSWDNRLSSIDMFYRVFTPTP